MVMTMHSRMRGRIKKDQKYLFYDIEGRQEGGYNIANLLIVQDENVSR